MRGAKRNGGMGFFFSKPARPASRSEVDAPLQISAPTDFRKVGHVSYRAATGFFSGLDAPVDVFFGVPLTCQPRVEVEGYVERIPSILVLLAREMIKLDGLNQEGLFRVPGESTLVDMSRKALNAGKGLQALDNEVTPHVLASLIKNWFRSLPDEVSILKGLPVAELVQMVKDKKEPGEIYERVCGCLSEPNKSMFMWITDLLAVVCDHHEQTLMTPKALATVFSPTLFVFQVSMESFGLMTDVACVLEKCILYSLMMRDTKQKEAVFAAAE